VQIEHVNKSHIRTEDLVARVLAARSNALSGACDLGILARPDSRHDRHSS